MTQDLTYSCTCGKTTARLHNVSPRTGNLARCHCRDCQAFATWLQQQGGADILDENGGTELWQTLAWRVEFLEGKAEHLKAMRLSPKGMIRWYAGCCHAPFGNTMGSRAMTFVGLPLSGFDAKAIDTMGKFSASISAKTARPGSNPPDDFGFGKTFARILWRQLKGKLQAKTRATPYWQGNAPVSDPQVLTLQERQTVTPD